VAVLLLDRPQFVEHCTQNLVWVRGVKWQPWSHQLTCEIPVAWCSLSRFPGLSPLRLVLLGPCGFGHISQCSRVRFLTKPEVLLDRRNTRECRIPPNELRLQRMRMLVDRMSQDQPGNHPRQYACSNNAPT
jgi:hypothetical protein